MPNKTETNPLYAVAGAADLAVAALREQFGGHQVRPENV